MLGLPPLPRTLEASVRDLSSSRPEVRASAIQDLVRHARMDEGARTGAVPLLVARLADEVARVRAAAAVALGDVGATEALDALVSAVDDDDAHVRQMALSALGEIGDPRVLTRLRRALGDARPEVRYQAVIAFTRVATAAKDEAAVAQALLTATNDEDDAIVHIALRLVEERLEAGAKADERLLIRARSILTNGSPAVAVVAAIVLARAGDARGHELLLRVVRADRALLADVEKEDEQAAVELVGELGLRAAAPALERRAWGLGRLLRDTCAFHARIALARMGHPRATHEILRDLGSSRPNVVGAAVVSAGRAKLTEAADRLARVSRTLVDPDLVEEAVQRLRGELPAHAHAHGTRPGGTSPERPSGLAEPRRKP